MAAPGSRPSPGPPAWTSPWDGGSWWSATSCSRPTPPRSTLAVTAQLARALDTWDGPGILIIAGNLFDLSAVPPAGRGPTSIEAHPALERALTRFLTVDERRVIRQTGTHEPGYDTDPEAVAGIAARGVEQAGPVDLHLRTTTGTRVVRVEPGEHAYAAGGTGPSPSSTRRPTPSPAPSATPRPAAAGGPWPPSPARRPRGWSASTA